MSNIDRAAQLLYKKGCCGSEDTAHYIASRLADAGLLAPDLPGPTMTDGGFAMWNLEHIDISADSECRTVYVDGNDITPKEAREEAAALLAAADHAEGVGRADA